MTKRITITETNAPTACFAEAIARLLVERERQRPTLSLVPNLPPAATAHNIAAHDQSSPLPAVI